VAAGTADGQTLVWRTGSWERVKATPPRLTREVASVSFSADGAQLASAGGDEVVITDPSAEFTVLQRLDVPSRGYMRAAFVRPGQLVTFSTEDATQLWPLEVDVWIKYACAITRRELTALEWREALGERRQTTTCHG
jgi:hypothetical protein